MFNTIQELTEEIERRININDVVTRYLNFKKGSGDSSFFCGIPGHDEKHPSFIAKQGYQTWKCSSRCGTGNLYQLVEKVKGINYIQAVKDLAEFSGINNTEIKLGDELTKLTNDLKNLSKEHLEYLNKRGITENTAKIYNLKSSGEYIVFPQILNNNLVGYKYLSIKDKTKKFFKGVNTQAKLYPDNNFTEIEIVIFTAGEWDCLYLSQELEKLKQKGLQEKNIKVVSNSTGEGSYPANIVQIFSKYSQIEAFKIFYDNDSAGKTGALKLANVLNTLGKDIHIFSFQDGCKKGYDVSDFLKDGNSADDLFGLPREKYNPEMSQRSDGNQYETEREILNFLINNNEFILDSIQKLQSTDIKDYRFSMLYTNIKYLYEKYKYCDFDLLRKKTRDVSVKDSIEEVIGASALGSFEEFLDNVEVLKENTTIRNIQKFSGMLNGISNQKLNRKEMLSEVVKQYEKLIIEGTIDDKGNTMDIILSNFLSSLDNKDEIRFITTPHPSVNSILQDGLRVNKLAILGALPSIGKTSYALQLADHVSEQNVPLVYYACETEEEEASEITLSRRSGLDKYYFSKKIFQNTVNPTELITNQYKDTDKNFHYVEAFDMTLSEVINDIRIKKRKYGIKFAVIDLLQAFKTEKGYANRTEFMADKTIDLVNLPKQEGIALLCLSHLKVPEKTAKNKKPRIEDLAQTSELGRRAYTAMFLDCEDKSKPEMKLIIRKNRNGVADVEVDLLFQRYMAKFIEAPKKQSKNYENNEGEE